MTGPPISLDADQQTSAVRKDLPQQDRWQAEEITPRRGPAFRVGGALVAVVNNRIDIPFRVFFANIHDVVQLKDVANGVFKSFCFAVIIGVVSCHQGLVTIGGPRGIGRSVTKAVVNSIVLIVIFDYFLTRTLLK